MHMRTRNPGYIFLLTCSLHWCMSTRLLNIACEYGPVQKKSAISNIPFQLILNLSSEKNG